MASPDSDSSTHIKSSNVSLGYDGRRKYSISEALANSFNSSMSPGPFEIGGRSYVSANRVSSQHFSLPTVYTGNVVHEQSANVANIGVTDTDYTEQSIEGYYDQEYEGLNSDSFNSQSPPTQMGRIETLESKDSGMDIDESSELISAKSPLLAKDLKSYTETYQFKNPFSDDLESGTIDRAIDSPNSQEQNMVQQYLLKPITYIPAVFLGTLLNILDGLSYGMIMFPISETIFSSLAPAGLSMFYLSCIVSQLVYSLGGSTFKAGIGSEMIEVTPFFHSMALSISSEMSDNGTDAIIATTIVTYAISSIVTGMVFFLLGKLKLGSLVGFFPRHILVGCIGGVGYFLVATGIEVSSRTEGGLEYNYESFKHLFFNYMTLLQWTIPLGLAATLVVVQHKYHNSLVVPLFFIAVFFIFHFLVLVIPSWNLDAARKLGWVFPSVEDNEPWYGFYELYKFNLVDWVCIVKQIPSMLALTFFGILHVPINVPALAVTVGMDQFDVDRELVAHGYSNVLSGLVGSIQNYLVYTNSVLFIRAGADDRLAGVLLALATCGVMIAGPVVIGYIPVCVVGSLIFLLGYELLKESLFDTFGKLRRIEYTTVIIIVVTMGVFDFVFGIFVGILLACLSFVVEAARRPIVKGMYTGAVARSTVLRHPKQQDFLKDVGDQICIIKLQGTLFFGSIGGVEKVIRDRFEDNKYEQNPIKFLILDMKGVDSIDFSAAEGFRRILNLLNKFNTQFIISSVVNDDEIVKALRDAGLWENDDDIKLFNTLNYALEWCENTFLNTYRSISKAQKHINIYGNNPTERQNSNQNLKSVMFHNLEVGTPRTTHVLKAATRTIKDEQRIQNRMFTQSDSTTKKQPLPLIMITFQGLSDKDNNFWSPITRFFIKERIPESFTFYDTMRDPPSFFIVESGLIESVINFESDLKVIRSSILPMTAFGDLNVIGQHRRVQYTTVSECIVWKLSDAKIKGLIKTPKGELIYKELLQIHNKLLRERLDTMTANLIIST